MKIVCLDMEGVVIPEIWMAVASHFGIAELNLTTRDIPDYDELMRRRLGVIAQHHITLTSVQKIIATMVPLAGAVAFLRTLRSKYPLILISDTFGEFIQPLMEPLEWPTVFCNRLIIEDDNIVDYRLRQQDGKRRAVEALQSIGYSVFAAGDSYNDLGMIEAANWGAFFCPPPSIVAENPHISVCMNYDQLMTAIERA